MSVESIDSARRTKREQPAGRVPPHNLGAEESLLGAVLLNRDVIGDVAELVEAADFYKPTHGHVFDAVSSLWAAGEPVDSQTVGDHLRRHGLLDDVGGVVALNTLQASTPSTTNAARYATIVAEHSLLRNLIGAAGEIAEMGYDLPDDVTAAIDAAEQRIFELTQRRRGGLVVRTANEALRDWLDVIEARAQSDGVPEIPTGWWDLDELLGGLHRSHLMIVGARPGMGKTSWAGALTRRVAQDAGLPVLFVSIEMSESELTGRMVAEVAHVDGSRLTRGRLSERDWDAVNNAVGVVGHLPIDIIDDAGATLMTVRSAARRTMARYGRLGAIVIDYLQLMASHGRRRDESREREVAELARGCKVLAKDLRVPVVALAQLSRNLEMRRDKRPTLADLRESGDLENSADAVVFIYRDDYYNPESPDRGIAEILVAKNRHGPQGVAKLAADLRWGTWSNMARAI